MIRLEPWPDKPAKRPRGLLGFRAGGTSSFPRGEEIPMSQKKSTTRATSSRGERRGPGEGAGEVTRLLRRWRLGEARAQEDLFALIYRELRNLAAHYMANERGGHTLPPTALVHEAFLRMARENSALEIAENRRHLFSIAARAMRRILVEHARYHAAACRPSSRDAEVLDEPRLSTNNETSIMQVLAIDQAMERLKTSDERMATVVELRFFAGLEITEVAEVLELSESTVYRDWRVARLVLQGFLEAQDREELSARGTS
ncbi:MAG: ECF-type sigma factor [Acidobacteriota bacterium]